MRGSKHPPYVYRILYFLGCTFRPKVNKNATADPAAATHSRAEAASDGGEAEDEEDESDVFARLQHDWRHRQQVLEEERREQFQYEAAMHGSGRRVGPEEEGGIVERLYAHAREHVAAKQSELKLARDMFELQGCTFHPAINRQPAAERRSGTPPPGPPSPPDERDARPLTESDISSVVDRLYDKDHYANRERQHKELERARAEAELAKCTFVPQTQESQTSRGMRDTTLQAYEQHGVVDRVVTRSASFGSSSPTNRMRTESPTLLRPAEARARAKQAAAAAAAESRAREGKVTFHSSTRNTVKRLHAEGLKHKQERQRRLSIWRKKRELEACTFRPSVHAGPQQRQPGAKPVVKMQDPEKTRRRVRQREAARQRGSRGFGGSTNRFASPWDPHPSGGGGRGGGYHHSHQRARRASAMAKRASVMMLGKALQSKGIRPNDFVLQADTNKDGRLSWAQFKQGVDALDLGLKPSQQLKVYKVFDKFSLGHVDRQSVARALAHIDDDDVGDAVVGNDDSQEPSGNADDANDWKKGLSDEQIALAEENRKMKEQIAMLQQRLLGKKKKKKRIKAPVATKPEPIDAWVERQEEGAQRASPEQQRLHDAIRAEEVARRNEGNKQPRTRGAWSRRMSQEQWLSEQVLRRKEEAAAGGGALTAVAARAGHAVTSAAKAGKAALHASAAKLEAVARGHAARANFLRKKLAATKLESAFRGFHARHEVDKKKKEEAAKKKEETRRRRASVLKRKKDKKRQQSRSSKAMKLQPNKSKAKKKKKKDANEEGMLAAFLAQQKARVKSIKRR